MKENPRENNSTQTNGKGSSSQVQEGDTPVIIAMMSNTTADIPKLMQLDIAFERGNIILGM